MNLTAFGKSFSSNPRWQAMALFIVSVLLYANTLGHDYTQDDAIVIYDNMFTTQGLEGIPGIFTNDTFFGFFKEEGKANLVSGGRYRPLSQVFFALEWEWFGRKPFIGHLFNVLWYALLGILILFTLRSLLRPVLSPEKIGLLSFVAALVFILHPVHTEVVANIKGRDEILSLSFCLMTFLAFLKAWDTQRKGYYLLAIPLFLAGLLSKENAITFVAVIPLAGWFFRDRLRGRWVWTIVSLLLPVGLFLWIRFSVLGFGFGSESMELMNNPFIKLEEGKYVPFSLSERLATILFILGIYLRLLFFPHPLTHDYYPRHIPVMDWGNWQVWLIGLLYLGLVGGMIWYWKKNRILAFAAAYYLVTLSIVSNLFFPIGTNLSERFLFMPSLGFALLPGWIWMRQSSSGKRIWVWFPFVVFVLLLAGKTIDRNRVWKDDFTLFTTDVNTSENSAKVLNAAGGALVTRASQHPDAPGSVRQFREAEKYLVKALSIHPNYKNAWLILGNARFYLKEYESAIAAFESALSIDPGFEDARKNLAISYREAGKFYGQEKNDLPNALDRLEKAYTLLPEDYETVRLFGIAHALSGQNERALELFLKAVALAPDNAGAFVNLGNVYFALGDPENGRLNHERALELDPEIFKKNSQ